MKLRCPHCGEVAITLTLAKKMDEKSIEMLAAPIDSHPWPTRLKHAFTRMERLEEIDGHWDYVDAPIKTFADLCALKEVDLLRTPNIGRTSLRYVVNVLESYGLQLAKAE